MIAFGGLGAVVLGHSLLFVAHRHGDSHQKFHHSRIRSKAFPWGDGDTELFGGSSGEHHH